MIIMYFDIYKDFFTIGSMTERSETVISLALVHTKFYMDK